MSFKENTIVSQEYVDIALERIAKDRLERSQMEMPLIT